MPRTGKNNERKEQVPRGRKKLTKIEPLRPQAEHPDKLYNDLAKFPSENPYPLLRIHKDGTVLYANKAGEELLKAKGSGLGQPAPAQWRRLAKDALVSGRVAREEIKNNEHVFLLQAVPVTSGDYVNFYGVDITEQKKAEEAAQTIAKFPSESPYPVLRINWDGTILYANNISEPLLSVRGSGVGQPAPFEWHRLTQEVLASGRIGELETEHNGQIFGFRAVPIAGSNYVNFYGRDITGQKMAEEEREITIKLLSIINSRNQIHDLMKLVTVLLKDWSGCEAVGIRLQNGEDFPYFETSGFSDEFIQAESKLCSLNELGEPVRDSHGRVFLECMCGNIISGRFDPSKPFFTKHGSFWTNSTTDLLVGTTDADRLTKTRNRCNTAGYESLALVPLRTGNETFGLLQLNSRWRNRFTPDKISLLERMADNLAVGLAQRKAEEALRESELKYRSLFENMTEGFAHCKILLDENDRPTNFVYLDVNDAFEELTGLKNVIGKKVTEVIPGIKDFNPELFEIYGRVALTGKPERFGMYLSSMGIWFSVSVYSPQKGHFVAVFENITQRKRAEEELLWKTTFLESQIEANLDGMLVVDGDNQKILTNKRLIELFKVPHHIVEDKDDTALLQYVVSQTKYPEQFLEKVKYLYSHQDQTSRDEIEFKNGMVFDRYSSPVVDKKGKYFGRIWTFRDITEQRTLEQMLEKERQELKLIIDSSPIIVFYKDKEGRFVCVNKAFTDALNKPEEQLLGKTVFDIYPGKFAQAMTDDDQEIFRTGKPKLNIIEQYKSVSGERWAQTDKVPIFDKDGILAGLVGFAQDITERKKAEELLKKSEEKFSKAFKAVPAAVTISTIEDGRYIDVNDVFLKTSGFQREEVIGHNAAELNVWLKDDQRRQYMKELARTGSLRNFEFQFRMRNGEIRDFLASSELIVLEGEKCSLNFILDITERKKAEDKLREASTYNRNLIEASPDPLVAIGPDGKITDVNIATEAITGYARTELVGTDFSDYFTEPKKAQAGYQQVFQEGMVYDYPLEIKHRDGHVTPVLYNASIYRNKTGEVVGAFAAARDITKRKRAEESLKESETRLRELFNNMSSGVAVYEAVDDGSDFIIRDFNAAGQRMEKISKEDAVGKRVTEVFPGVKDMGLLDVFRRVWQTGMAEQHPTNLYKDGRISGWRENYIYKLPCGDLVAIYDDVTERQLAQERLQEERNLLRTLIDNIPDKVYVKDKDSRFVVSNKTLNEYWLTLGENEIIGKTDFDLFEPAKAQEYFDKEQEMIRTGQAVINQEGYCENKAGNISYLLVTKVPLKDSHDNITGLLGIHRDITERKLAEEKLEQERNLLRTLIDHIPDKVYVKDKNSRFVTCNKATIDSEYLESETEIIGKTDFDLYDRETAQKLFDDEQELMRTGKPSINLEYQRIDKTGNLQSALQTKVPLSDSRGNIVGIVGINRDITERTQVEHKLLEHQNHLKQLAARLALTEERERRHIASEIHDEISQTLAMIKIKLDTLRSSLPSEASAAEIKEISSSVEKVIQETRTLTFELSNPLLYEVGLETAVAEWLDEHIQEKHGIATEFQDDGKAKPLDDDVKMMLFRNVRELRINCIKHAKAGKVRVGIRRINGSIEVVVEDNGVGFDPSEVRLTTGKKSKFGLFSVRESLENLGGRLEIESKPGAGCKAIMTAPLKDQSHK